MIAMVIRRVRIQKAHSTARAGKDFLETEKTAVWVSLANDLKVDTISQNVEISFVCFLQLLLFRFVGLEPDLCPSL